MRIGPGRRGVPVAGKSGTGKGERPPISANPGPDRVWGPGSRPQSPPAGRPSPGGGGQISVRRQAAREVLGDGDAVTALVLVPWAFKLASCQSGPSPLRLSVLGGSRELALKQAAPRRYRRALLRPLALSELRSPAD